MCPGQVFPVVLRIISPLDNVTFIKSTLRVYLLISTVLRVVAAQCIKFRGRVTETKDFSAKRKCCLVLLDVVVVSTALKRRLPEEQGRCRL